MTYEVKIFKQAQEALIIEALRINKVMCEVDHSYNTAQECPHDAVVLEVVLLSTRVKLSYVYDFTPDCSDSWYIPEEYFYMTEEDIKKDWLAKCEHDLKLRKEAMLKDLKQEAEKIGYTLVEKTKWRELNERYKTQ